jgi:peptide/nickel transport system substrate-binding protein
VASDSKRGGTLVVAFSSKVSSMDPPNGNVFPSEGNVYIAIYERLLRPDEDGNLVPELATSWDVSADGKQITFKLRKGVSFHDGTPFNAEVAKFNLDRLMDKEDATQAYGFFTDMKSVQVVDEYTIRIGLSRPSSVILTALSRNSFMNSPAAMRKWGEDYAQHPTGTGPFKFVNWVPGSSVDVVRNENYWQMGEDGKPLPYLDEIRFRIIGEDPVRVIELQSGNADMIDRVPDAGHATIQNDPNLMLVDSRIAVVYRLYLNQREAPFDNLKLRQALNYAFDRETMAEVLMPDGGFVAPFMYLPSQPEYSDYTPYSYDPEKAKRLLVEAGYPNGLDVEFMLISREPDRTMAPVVQSYLEEIGIRTEIQPLDRLVYIEKGKSGNFEMGMAQKTLPMPAIHILLTEQLRSDGAGNRAAYSSSEFDALLDKLAVTFDPEEQKRICAQLQKVCLDDAGQTFLFHKAYYQGWNKKVKGVTLDHVGTWRFHEAWVE